MKTYKRKNSLKSKIASTSLRLNIILGIICVLFLLLIGQLAYLQLIYGGRFQTEVQKTDKKIVCNNVPRGVMYDSKGRILVGNKANNAITYTKNSNLTTAKIYDISEKLSKYIRLNDETPTKHQLFDYYLANSKNALKINRQLPRNQRYDEQPPAQHPENDQ